MYKARYYNADGSESGEQALPEWLFDGVVHESAMHQVVKVYRANQRQGTGSAKSRGQVAGGSRKPWRQKGTGRARAGTIRSPIWEGGGVAFPPIPHSWRQRVPRKVRALARRSALNSRAGGERVLLVDPIELESPKTKAIVGLLGNMGVEGKALILTNGAKENVHLSARNIPGVEVRPFGQESVYDILWASVVVIEKDALEGAGPSRADQEAEVTRKRGEPEVRVRHRAEAEAQAERRKARMGHEKKSRPVVASKPAPPAEPKVEAPAEASDIETSNVETPAPAADADSGIDVASVKLPNVGDLLDFLEQFDDAADVRELKERDSRKTAQSYYDARILALSGPGGDVASSDADSDADEEE